MDSKPQRCYSVYLARNDGSSSYRVPVPDDPSGEVGDLARTIQHDELIRPRLRNEGFTLYKYSRPFEGTPADFLRSVKKWLHSNDTKEKMVLGSQLKDYFPNGPSPEKKQVDVVIATNSFMESHGDVRQIPSSLDSAFRKRERPISAEDESDRLTKLAKQASSSLTVAVTSRGSDESTVPRAFNSNIYKRDNTVAIIWNKLLEYKLIWVHGPSGSGKSILARLLELYIIEKGNPNADVRRIIWAKPESSDIKAEILQAIGYKQRRDTVIIIDEAQSSYSETDIWATFKNVRDLEGIYVVGFARYGSQFLSEELSTISFTPPTLIAAQTITLLHIDHNDGKGTAGLLFTKDELDAMVQQWYKHGHPPIDQELLDVLFESTAGHIGAIYDFMELIGNRHHTVSLPLEGLYTWKMFRQEFMRSPGQFMNAFLPFAGAFARGLPRDSRFQKQKYAHALEFVVQYRRVLSSKLSDPCLKRDLLYCVRAGWLHCDKIHLNKDEDVFFFASPLHQWFVERMLLRKKQSVYVEGELYDFVVNVIRQFDPKLLVESRSIHTSITQERAEAQYQDEFYRCAHQLSRGAVLHSEFGTPADQIDFHVFCRQWKIELIRDSDRLMEHHECFQPGGAYNTTLELKDWIILDFRTTMPKKHHPHIHNLYHIVFTSDFIDVTILDNMLQPRKEFRLLQQ